MRRVAAASGRGKSSLFSLNDLRAFFVAGIGCRGPFGVASPVSASLFHSRSLR
jgi:hypothetical protein